jgi:predicted  nucleic acid-binding Zn-ribbon protein
MIGEYMGKPFRYWHDLEIEHTQIKAEYDSIIKYPQVKRLLVLENLLKQTSKLQDDIKTIEEQLDTFHKKLTEINTND